MNLVTALVFALSVGELARPVEVQAFVKTTQVPIPQVNYQWIQYPLVRQVICASSLGTAFLIEGGRMLSVSHVTDNAGCTIDGEKFGVVAESALDFAVIDHPRKPANGFKINCDGFIPNKWYWAIGHARGAPFQQVVRVFASVKRGAKGERILVGHPNFIPGMSGGPVLNEAGEVVGTVNAYHPFYPLSFSRELKDTSVCRK